MFFGDRTAVLKVSSGQRGWIPEEKWFMGTAVLKGSQDEEAGQLREAVYGDGVGER